MFGDTPGTPGSATTSIASIEGVSVTTPQGQDDRCHPRPEVTAGASTSRDQESRRRQRSIRLVLRVALTCVVTLTSPLVTPNRCPADVGLGVDRLSTERRAGSGGSVPTGTTPKAVFWSSRARSTGSIAICRETALGDPFSVSIHDNHPPCRKVTAPRSAGSHPPNMSTRARRRGFLAGVPSRSRDSSGLAGRERRSRMMFMAPLKCRCIHW